MFIIEDYPFENPYYHKPSDTLGTLNLAFHHKVTQSLVAAVAFMAHYTDGDLDNDGDVDLADAVWGLRILAGADPATLSSLKTSDLNGDGKFGLAETLYILQRVSKLR